MTNVAYVINESTCEFTDVTQAVATGQNFDKGTKVLHAADGSIVDFANLNGCRASFDSFECFLSQWAIGTRDCDATIFGYFDDGLRFFLDGANVFATRANQHSNLIWLDLSDQQARSVF